MPAVQGQVDPYMDQVMRMRTAKLNRQNVLSELPCWGHFHPARCAKRGFIGPCPYKNTCRQETDRQDAYRFHELELSHDTIARLKGRNP